MNVAVSSTDGNNHDVQVYSDISAEWVSGDLALTANWSTNTEGDIVAHQLQLETQTILGEVNDHTQCMSIFVIMVNVLFILALQMGLRTTPPWHRFVAQSQVYLCLIEICSGRYNLPIWG
jgi:hypothetical protein